MKWEQFKIVILFMDHPVPIIQVGNLYQRVPDSSRNILRFKGCRYGRLDHRRHCSDYDYVGVIVCVQPISAPAHSQRYMM